MSNEFLSFTAESTLASRPGALSGTFRGLARRQAGALTLACRCTDFQPGCGCLAFCHRKTAVAVARCQAHMENNAACKQPGVLCYGCHKVPHSDQAQYHICR